MSSNPDVAWRTKSVLFTMTCRVLALLAVLLLVPTAAAAAWRDLSSGLVHRAGKWLVDREGRVVVVHGFNIVHKYPPFVRTEFGPSDARLLAREGFTVARVGFIWEGVEPPPGKYDDAYITRVLKLVSLLARYGIRSLVDFHQDAWSRYALSSPFFGDGAPAWATVGSNSLQSVNDSFAAFWRNAPGPGGVGVQTRFLRAWHHVAEKLRNDRSIIGLDPFNEPYAGSDYPTCGLFQRCPQFETGALATFYQHVTAAIRSAGARQVIFPEGIADSGQQPPVLPKLHDPQAGFNFHFYCPATQGSSAEVPVGAPSPEAQVCAPIEQTQLGRFTNYANQLGVPGFLSEFSCNDVNPDNAQVVDLMARTFTSWTAWAYYNGADDPADCPRQGLLINDQLPGSEANAKQDKLDALAVPYAEAIAGTPQNTNLDRASRTYTLSYRSTPVPGAWLWPWAPTRIFVPARMYPAGYIVHAEHARIGSRPNARWLLLTARQHAEVSVTIAPRS